MKTPIVNPLDELFNTERQVENEVVEYDEVTEGDLVPAEAPPEKDEEDVEIDKKIDGVYDAAIEAFNTQTAYTQIIEPRYAARNAEVAANYLNIALNAATARGRLKTDRKRATAFIPHGNGSKTSTNVVVASREDILRMMSVDAETKEIK